MIAVVATLVSSYWSAVSAFMTAVTHINVAAQ